MQHANDARDWEACQEGEYIHCRSELGQTDGRYRCVNTNQECAHGTLARYRLKIPESTKPSAHTILNFRWDTFENNEAFLGCADIKISGDLVDDDPAPAPAPAPAPSECTEANEDAWGTGQFKSCCDGLEQCTEPRDPSDPYFNQYPTIEMCRAECGADDPVPSPTAKPVSAPTPKPVSPTAKPQADDSAGYCCFWPQSADRCGQCESPAEPGNWCAKGRTEQCLMHRVDGVYRVKLDIPHRQRVRRGLWSRLVQRRRRRLSQGGRGRV